MSASQIEDLITFILKHSEQYTEAELRSLSITDLVLIKVGIEIDLNGRKGGS